MENNELKIKIDKQIKKLLQNIEKNSSDLEIKENQRILNELLKKYLQENKI